MLGRFTESGVGVGFCICICIGYVVESKNGFNTTVGGARQLLLTEAVECGLKGLDSLGAHYVFVQLVPLYYCVHKERVPVLVGCRLYSF